VPAARQYPQEREGRRRDQRLRGYFKLGSDYLPKKVTVKDCLCRLCISHLGQCRDAVDYGVCRVPL
jgi:hypothetical protein